MFLFASEVQIGRIRLQFTYKFGINVAIFGVVRL